MQPEAVHVPLRANARLAQLGQVHAFCARVLGGARSSASLSGFGSTSDTAFALALGGGVDVGSKNIAVRIGQFDCLLTRFGGTSQNNFRYSAGIVFRFGS